MAKSRSIIRLRGTLGGVTFVDSAAYGTHTRLPRGTHKPANVNASLQANADRAKAVTAFGKGLLPLLKAEGETFYRKDLWQLLLKRLFGSLSADAGSLVEMLPGLELHDAYPLERLVTLDVEATAAQGKLTGRLLLRPLSHKGVKAVRFSLVVLWTDGTRWEDAPALQEWVAVNSRAAEAALPFAEAAPRWASHYALLLKAEGGDGTRVSGSFAEMGMQVVGSGKVRKKLNHIDAKKTKQH